ncbi:MAG: PAS domain S-box protein [Opitutus sp.]
MSRRPTTIAVPVILSVVSVTTLFMIAAAVLSYSTIKAQADSALRQEQSNLAEQASVALALPAWNFDEDQINRVLNGVMMKADIERLVVRLTDRHKTVYTRTRPARKRQAEERFIERRRINLGDTELGDLEVEFTTLLMEQKLRRYRLGMIAVTVALDGLLIAGLYFLLWKTVVRPVREIEQFALAREYSDANVTTLAGRHYSGELETLRDSMVGLIRDLRANEIRLRLLGDNLPGSMVFQLVRNHDGTMRFLYVSAGVQLLHGLTAESVLRDPAALYGQFLEADLPTVVAAEAASAAALSVFNVIVRVQLPDGAIRWRSICAQPRRQPDGRVVWDGIETDITEHKLATEDRERLARAIDAHYDGAYWLDTDNRITAVNAAGCRAVGYTEQELIGQPLTLIHPGATPERMNQVWAHLRTDGFYTAEFTHVRKDGTVFPVEVASTLVRIGGREFNCAFARDISVRKASEESLRQRLAELQRWQNLNLNRETRVRQLKAEVNELRLRLGQPESYLSQVDSAKAVAVGASEVRPIDEK